MYTSVYASRRFRSNILKGRGKEPALQLRFKLAPMCVKYLIALFAKALLGNKVGTLVDKVGEVFIDHVSPTSVAGAVVAGFCSLTNPPPPPTSSQPICPSGKSCVVVANSGNNTITVYDEQGKQIQTPPNAFPDLNEPDGITYDGKNGYFYVMNTGNHEITAYDLDGNEAPLTSGFPINVNGEDIKYDPMNDSLYVNDPTDSQIFVYNASTGSQIFPNPGFGNVDQPWGVFWNPTTNYVYVSNGINNSIEVYGQDGTPVNLTGPFFGLKSPDDFVVDTATGNMYVTEASGDNSGGCSFSGLAEYDINGNNITPQNAFSTVHCPDDMLIDPTNAQIYVANIYGNNITIYNMRGQDITSAAAPGGFQHVSGPAGLVLITTP